MRKEYIPWWHMSNIGGGGLDAYKSQMAFWSGDLDIDNLQWLDQSGNDNHADIVDIPCVLFNADATLTIISNPLTTETVAKVNESASLTAGVSVSGGNIAIDFSELTVTDNKIWSIELSDGDVFVLQSRVKSRVFSATNSGYLIGTEGVTWEHSTSDIAYPYHLVNGFSKYFYSHALEKQTFNITDGYELQEQAVFDVLWEGFVSYNTSQRSIFNLMIEGSATGIMCEWNRTANKIYFGNRNNVTFSVPYTADISTVVKIRLQYNGNGFDAMSNYTVTVDDVELTKSSESNTTRDRTSWLMCGGYADPVAGIINHYVEDAYKRTNFIVDGEVISLLTQSAGDTDDLYIHIPVFNGANLFGSLITNPASTDTWNGAPLKIKMPVASAISDNDVNNILYTNPSTPNALDLSQFYPQFGSKIHCDNSGGVKNLIVTTEELDLQSLLNGYIDRPLLVNFRTDTGISGDGSAKLPDLATETGLRPDIHLTRVTEFDSAWGALVSSGQMAMGIHDMLPSFWKYANATEGALAYTNSTADEKTNGIVPASGLLGTLGEVFGGGYTGKEYIEQLQSNTGYAWPGTGAPNLTDNNEDWWEWVLDAFDDLFDDYGTATSFSYLGALPSGDGLNLCHFNVLELIQSRYYSKNSQSKTSLSLSDDLDNSVSIFSGAENDSIVDDGGINVQKLSGSGTTARGMLSLGQTDWYKHDTIKVKFDAKATAATGDVLPFSAIRFMTMFDTIDFDTNIDFFGTNYTNPCSVDTWYSIELIMQKGQDFGHENGGFMSKIEMKIFNASGTCLLFTRLYTQPNRYRKEYGLIVYADDVDVLIKNVTVDTIQAQYINRFPWNDVVKWDSTGYSVGDTAEEHRDKKLASCIADLSLNKEVAVFSHDIKDPDSKAADGTYDGVMDRSYDGLKYVFDHLAANGIAFKNSKDLDSLSELNKRYNYANNGDFETTYLGINKATPWQNALCAVDATETTNNSVDGTNVISIPSGQTLPYVAKYYASGKHRIRFWYKGHIRVFLNNNDDYINSNGQTQAFVSASWEFIDIPIWIDNPEEFIQIQIYSSGTSYLHKLRIE